MAKKKLASLFISAVEVARIELEGNKKVYLYADYDDAGFSEVSKAEFKKKMAECKDVCYNSWNKQLRKDYDNIIANI